MKFTFIFTSIILFVFLGISLILYLDYRSWKTELENTMQEGATLNFEADRYDGIREDLDKKVETFVSSTEPVETLTITEEEVAVLLYDSFSNSLPEDLTVKSIFLSPGEGEWVVYTKLELSGVELPWMSAVVAQENFQTAELFIKEINVGPYNLNSLGLGYLVNEINDGYRNALIFVNENGVASRRYENIELLEDEIVIKGRKEN